MEDFLLKEVNYLVYRPSNSNFDALKRKKKHLYIKPKNEKNNFCLRLTRLAMLAER
jgi:hypothetical protein